MPQLLHTGRFGTIEVEKSWVETNLHICKLTNGGYVYVSGLPVNSEADIRKAIPPGPEREAALQWLATRDLPEEEPKKRIVINPDGSCVFDDGSPVENISDILNYIPPGPFQDAAYRWLQEKKAREKALKEKAAKAVVQAVEAIKKEAPSKKPVSSKTASKKVNSK